uniref:Pro-secreted protein ORF2 n=1 Tax=Necromys lasiurus Hepatitis E virus TaxID=2054593 RepID=A0A2H4PSL6_9VIRU|nr:capsid protein [Necromys lasiurus Hepatitis E virus]
MLPGQGGGSGGPGSGRGGRSRRSGPGPAHQQPYDQRAHMFSASNPFLADIYTSSGRADIASPSAPLGSAWANPQRSRRRGGPGTAGQSYGVRTPTGVAPLTTAALAPDTRPVPDVDSRGSILSRQYNLSTSPLVQTVPTSTNTVLYAASLNPLLPLQDGSNTHIMATEASNYAQYRVQAATLRFRPLVPNSVGGYAISMSFWPQSTTAPTSVDMNSITATDVRIVSQPGVATELVLPRERLHYRNQGWRSVETNGVAQEECTSGLVMVCIHGTPVNSYTNTPYTGALGMLDFALQLEFRNLTPGNTNTRVNRYRATARHTLKRGPGGSAQIATSAATRFMQDIHLVPGSNGIGDIGKGIVQVLFNVADTLLGGLPTELIQNAGGQLFYGRPQIAANGEPAIKIYPSVEAAQLDQGISISHDIDLGVSAVTLQDYDNQHQQDRPTPAPAPQRPVNVLKTGDVLWLTLPTAEYKQSQDFSSSPVYWSENAIVINVATGQQAAAKAINWADVTLNGKPLPKSVHEQLTYYQVPCMGKISFWQQSTTTAGYTYNYNTKDSDSFWVWADSATAYLYIPTYTTMLGTGPVNITGICAVGPNPTSEVEVLASHTFDEFCGPCRDAGLPECTFLGAIQKLRCVSATKV